MASSEGMCPEHSPTAETPAEQEAVPAEFVFPPVRNQRVPGYARWLLLFFGLGLFVLLGTAAWLKPDPYGLGLGTHEQLGLPPCGFREYFGIRCPSCGMTTSWSYLVRGRVLSALASNTGGTLLGVLALLAAPWMVISALRGKWFLGIPSEPLVLSALGAFVVVTLADWLVRLLW